MGERGYGVVSECSDAVPGRCDRSMVVSLLRMLQGLP